MSKASIGACGLGVCANQPPPPGQGLLACSLTHWLTPSLTLSLAPIATPPSSSILHISFLIVFSLSPSSTRDPTPDRLLSLLHEPPVPQVLARSPLCQSTILAKLTRPLAQRAQRRPPHSPRAGYLGWEGWFWGSSESCGHAGAGRLVLSGCAFLLQVGGGK
jgi:hypothetical protein